MNEYLEINEKVYNQLAQEYLLRREKPSEFEETTEYLGDSVFKYISKKSQKNVLEIGPGAGQILGYFENKGCRTIGIELSKNMAEVAKQYSPKSIIINEDVNNVDLLENQFQLVYMGALIHLFPKVDARKLLLKVWKWLEQGGIIFINTTCHNYSYEGFYEKKDYNGKQIRFRKYWTEQELEEFVLNCEFSIIQKLYTYEVDRNKKWVALICKKEGK